MALPVNGTPAATERTAGDTTFTANLPSGIQAGEVLCVFYMTSSDIRSLEASGWTDQHFDASTLSMGVIWKVATGSEGATQEFTYTGGGSAGAWAVAVRTSLDSTTPFVIANTQSGQEATEDPFTLDADLITGLGAGNHVFLLWGAGATRTIDTLDADLELIGSVTAGVAGACLHVAGEESVASNSAYSNDMSGSRDYLWMLLEAQPAGGGGSQSPLTAIMQHHG